MTSLFRCEPFKTVLAAVIVIMVAGNNARACDYLTLRDDAFDRRRDVHQLSVIGSADDAEAQQIHQRLQSWMQDDAASMNLELVFVDVDDPDVAWEDYANLPSAPPGTPLVLLSGTAKPGQPSFYIDRWEPSPDENDLQQLEDSPARQALRERLGKQVAVILYMPGSGAGAVSRREAIEAAVAKWDARNWLPVSVLEVDRNDPDELLLRRFTNIPEDGPDWMAVVFGRGRFMPALEGQQITVEAIRSQLGSLIERCACSRTSASLGVNIPMVWDEADETTVVRLLDEESAPTVDTLAVKANEPDERDRGQVYRVVIAVAVVLSAVAAVVSLALVFGRSGQRA